MSVLRALILLGACGAVLALGLGSLAVGPRWAEGSPAPRDGERSIGLFDAHLHLAVHDVRVVPPAGAGPATMIVTVRARNDAARIDIDPSRLVVRVVSRGGRSYLPIERVSSDEQRFASHLAGTLRPGDSIDQSFLFELPPEVDRPFLVLESEDGPLPMLPRTVVRLLGGRVELEL
jgi:hypothetical protein